jgi:hypothetical protein
MRTLLLRDVFSNVTIAGAGSSGVTGHVSTVTVTLSVERSLDSLTTVKVNVSEVTAVTVGAVNVGVAEFVVSRVTRGPPLACCQVYVRSLSCGSVLPDPSSVTGAPEFTV